MVLDMPNFTESLGQSRWQNNLPNYPLSLQLLRVTIATVPGPSGGTSTGPGVGNVPPSVLYVASTQQLRTDTLAPRDREPCLVVDVAGAGLTAGYYLGRLAGSYNGLPVYEVVTAPSGSGVPGPQGPSGTPGGFLVGLTSVQLATINASLTPTQIDNLNNLDACQLQILLQIPIVNIQLLTNLTPTKVAKIVDKLTYPQLLQTVTGIPPAQVDTISGTYPQLYEAINQLLTPPQVLVFLKNLTLPQLDALVSLTPAQLEVAVQTAVPQLQTLTNLTDAQVATLVGQLTPTKLSLILSTLTTPQLQQLADNFTDAQIATLANQLTAVQIAALTTPQLTVLAGITPAELQLVTQLTNAQIQTLTSGLTSAELQSVLRSITVSRISTLMSSLNSTRLLTLSRYTLPTVNELVDRLSTANLITFLNISTPPPSPILGSQSYFPVVPSIVGQPSSTPAPIPQGFAPIAVDMNTGRLWAYTGGAWAAVNNLSQFSGLLPLNSGGTGTSLSDPGAHTVVGWNNTSSVVKFFTLGSGISYDAATNTINISAGTSVGTVNEVQVADGSGGFASPGSFTWNGTLADIDGDLDVLDDILLGGELTGLLATFNNGSFAVELAAAGRAGYFIDDISNVTMICDGTWAINVTAGSINIVGGAYNANSTPGLASQVVALAKITGLGADGSITITGGIVTAYTAPT